MADVLFRYLLMARDRDQAWYQRAFLADERLLAAGVERLVETAAVVVRVCAQYERITETHVVAPASAASRHRFYTEPEPNRPVAPHPEMRTERFPLESSLTITECGECKDGHVRCSTCGGRGEVMCHACQGNGALGSCANCGGQGMAPCRGCHGALLVRHARCGGEGSVAKWREQVHSYWTNWHNESHLPPEAPRLAIGKAVDRWLGVRSEPLSDLRRAAVVERLGYDTPQVARVVAHAERSRSELEKRARSTPERCLFCVPSFEVVPVEACLLRSEETASAVSYWLIGRGDHAIELRPRPVADRWKLAGWSGLCAGLAASEAFSQATSLLPEIALSSAALAGLALAGVGLWRLINGQRTPVKTVALLRAGPQPTSYLPCLATLGAYTRNIEVMDRTYRAQLEALMTERGASPTSRSVVIRLGRGQLVRLTEVARPEKLSRHELARIAEMVDGVVFLEEPDHPADTLRSSLHAATTARPPEARIVLDSETQQGDHAGLTPRGALAIDWIRRAFIREVEAPLEWPAVFEQLWWPVSTVLAGTKLAPVWPASTLPEANRAGG